MKIRTLTSREVEAQPYSIWNSFVDLLAMEQYSDLTPEQRVAHKDVVEDGEEARLILGSLWGEQLVKEFGWQWAKITFHDYDDSFAYGVFSPDRSMAIYPLEFMLGALRDPTVDVTVMLAFNMLKAGKIPKMTKKSYTNVMESVHRIVPRD